jgi:TRAP-type mannitol/chloroaromatic compound transport system substrate-binding protein
VVSNRGTGTFSDVTYVQRVGTAGGKAPAGGCDAAAPGTREVSYTAEYYFYAGSPAQAGH